MRVSVKSWEHSACSLDSSWFSYLSATLSQCPPGVLQLKNCNSIIVILVQSSCPSCLHHQSSTRVSGHHGSPDALYFISHFWQWAVASYVFLLKVMIVLCVLSRCNRLWLFESLWTVAHQAPPFVGFSRQEYWSRLPFPPPGDLLDPGIELLYPALASGFFITESPEKPPI